MVTNLHQQPTRSSRGLKCCVQNFPRFLHGCRHTFKSEYSYKPSLAGHRRESKVTAKSFKCRDDTVTLNSRRFSYVGHVAT